MAHRFPRFEVTTTSTRQRGANSVEFAFTFVIFVVLLFGIIEFGRLLFTWNSATEATRFGARVAAVCDVGSASVVTMMRRFLPQASSTNVSVTYTPTGCTKANCESVSVSIGTIAHPTYIPFVSINLNIPAFSTYIVREMMESANSAGEANPTCTNPWDPALPGPAILH